MRGRLRTILAAQRLRHKTPAGMRRSSARRGTGAATRRRHARPVRHPRSRRPSPRSASARSSSTGSWITLPTTSPRAITPTITPNSGSASGISSRCRRPDRRRRRARRPASPPSSDGSAAVASSPTTSAPGKSCRRPAAIAASAASSASVTRSSGPDLVRTPPGSRWRKRGMISARPTARSSAAIAAEVAARDRVHAAAPSSPCSKRARSAGSRRTVTRIAASSSRRSTTSPCAIQPGEPRAVAVRDRVVGEFHARRDARVDRGLQRPPAPRR